MASFKEPNLGLNYGWNDGESGWQDQMDENLRAIGALVQGAIKSVSVTTPPPDAVEGDRYIIPTGATGVWAGHTGKVTRFNRGVWEAYTPREGWEFRALDSGIRYAYISGGWVTFGLVDGVEAVQQGAGIIVDNTDPSNPVVGLQDERFTTALKSKLESLESSHWRGHFVSLAQLQATIPVGNPGDYADVDAGEGEKAVRYIWDISDEDWVDSGAEVPPLTASQVKLLYESNPNTNAFTDAEKSKLGGIEAGAEVNKPTNLTVTSTVNEVTVQSSTGSNAVIPWATAERAGVMSASAAEKLGTMEEGATANSSDAYLLDRANHTGEQSIHTVEGLYEALQGKVNTNDSRLTDSREWSSATMPLQEAQDGTANTRRAITAHLLRQAMIAWWDQSDGKDLLEELAGESGLASFSWDSSTSTPAAAYPSKGSTVTLIHRLMRRCVLGRDGVRKFYLHPNNSDLKEDGSAYTPEADDMVMVEIPKCWYRTEFVGTITTWYISTTPRAGFKPYPAFLRSGVWKDFRYYSAYDGCVRDVSADEWISGLNLDNAESLLDLGNDYMASVPGVYPIVGVTRPQCRQLAENIGPGWSMIDFWLVNLIQLLFMIEHQTLHTQGVLGAGNTGGSYTPSSADQNDSPHTIAGASNSLGNGSTNTATGASSNNKPGIAFMSYRGIENWYGNAYDWVDGFNILDHQAFVSNDVSTFADNTTTGYEELGTPMPNVNGYPNNHQPLEVGMLPASIGGSTSTGWCDYYYQNTGWRTAPFGGAASAGGIAGGLFWNLNSAASGRSRYVSSRVAF